MLHPDQFIWFYGSNLGLSCTDQAFSIHRAASPDTRDAMLLDSHPCSAAGPKPLSLHPVALISARWRDGMSGLSIFTRCHPQWTCLY